MECAGEIVLSTAVFNVKNELSVLTFKPTGTRNPSRVQKTESTVL